MAPLYSKLIERRKQELTMGLNIRSDTKNDRLSAKLIHRNKFSQLFNRIIYTL